MIFDQVMANLVLFSGHLKRNPVSEDDDYPLWDVRVPNIKKYKEKNR